VSQRGDRNKKGTDAVGVELKHVSPVVSNSRMRRSSSPRRSLDVVVRVGSAAQEGAEAGAAAADHEQSQEDVDEGGGPEGKQVEVPVAVRVHIGRVPVVVGLVNRVYPHIT